MDRKHHYRIVVTIDRGDTEEDQNDCPGVYVAHEFFGLPFVHEDAEAEDGDAVVIGDEIRDAIKRKLSARSILEQPPAE